MENKAAEAFRLNSGKASVVAANTQSGYSAVEVKQRKRGSVFAPMTRNSSRPTELTPTNATH